MLGLAQRAAQPPGRGGLVGAGQPGERHWPAFLAAWAARSGQLASW